MKTTCEFRFGFWDVSARADASLQVTDNQPWARIEDINREDGAVFPNTVTLEPGFGWPLDGSKEWFPAIPQNENWGWWSGQLSQADGSFAAPQTLTVTFTENHSSAGLTFRFFATLPRSINIKWYSLKGELLQDRDFIPDSLEYFCECQVENYGKVIVTIPSMAAAHRFLRCAFLLFGATEIIDWRRVQKASLLEEISPVSLTLPVSTLNLSFFTPGGRFSLLNPSGAYRLFQWKQQVTAYASLEGEKRYMGVYYLQEASGLADSLVDLQLVDIVGVLDTLSFDGGIYNGVPVRELLDAVLEPEDVGYALDLSLENVTLTGYLPVCSKREALQQIAFALGAIVDTTRGDVMRFYPLPSGACSAIEPSRKITGHKVTLGELVTRVDVTAHSYRLDSEARELVKTVLPPGLHRLNFSAPAKTEAAAGGVLVKSHPNYAVVEVSRETEVILTGREYRDDASVFTVQTDPLPAGAKSSAKAVKDATLLDAGKAMKAAQRVYEYYQLRYTGEGRLLPGGERVGQKAELQSLGGRTLSGPVERIITDLTGSCIITMTMKGA